MDNALIRMTLGLVIRHALTALSAYLVAKQLLAPEHASGFIDSMLVYVTDAMPIALATFWSFVQKYNQNERTK